MTNAASSSAGGPSAGPAPAAPQASYPPLAGGQRLLGTVALSAAVFMNVLDTSIANVSLPAISGDLGVSTSQGTWVITSFAVANAIALPLTGWLTMRFGQVRLFVASVLLFILASWLCGLAPNLQSLIAFRVLQGLVAGPMIPLSQALMLGSYPREKSGMALALWSMTTLVAPVAGPLLGGWISDNYSWPWIFYINIPVGLVSAWVSWSIYHKRESPIRKLPIDTVGLVLLVVWIAALQIMLDKGKELDWFASGTIVALAVVAVVGVVLFVIWELTDKHPVVDLRLFAGRNFTVGALTLSVAYAVFFGNVVLLPLWLQTQMGYTATDAGLVTAPIGLLAIVLTPVIGRMMTRADPRVLVTVAFVVFAAVSFMRSDFTPQADIVTLLEPTVLQGAGMAAFFVPLVSLTLAGLPPDKIASASGLSNFLRITAGAFGTSISTTMWENRAAMHHAHLTEHITAGSAPASQAMSAMQGAGMAPEQALASVDNLINGQALTMSAVDIFYGSAVIFLALIAMVWFARPGKPGSGAPVDAGGAH
ncbi:MAG: DHA2 family efflux MFS transporter permease subunit [Pigmentiphaga sp.]|uniref:DHA2 family efflux MFS transporter permease subunit n=1 Tax=Pigmentiphaga sp. TaxID=1977564 RepID=UPI0029ABD94F|nr:DHA2 family efflux MFS transporter permease subunit [Pigmentiphaga sp.]MDX3907591.1 DHA2 family efflux MFS transporter permease subunit [Pigmentiphaga sp.]